MEKIKDFTKKPIAIGIAGLIIGIVIGLVGLGWGLWPLQWTDAAPADLQIDYQRDYLCMVIDSYIRNQDSDLVRLRWQGLGDKAEELLYTLTPALCRFSSEKEIMAFQEMISAGMLYEPNTKDEKENSQTIMDTASSLQGIPQDQVEADSGGFPPMLLGLLILITLAVGGVFVFMLLRRKPKPVVANGAPKAFGVQIMDEPDSTASQTEPKITPNEPPLAQFMTTYRQGDDLYDDSFSIDSINGEFLGECGVGIAETIGVGEPKKVTALEIWLFAKNDIQTVTKVLLSEHANNDPTIKQRLLSKGEPILAEPGKHFSMNTTSLQLEAKVVDMVYARGPLPENSYFSRLTLEISVWAK